MQKRFSDEFKKSAIARVRNGETQIDVAKSLGIKNFKSLVREG